MTPPECLEDFAECGELRRCREPVAHQLNLVENPEAVVIQQAEVHRPTEAAHRVAAVERARKQHVLRAYQDALAFRLHVPLIPRVAAHQRISLKVFEAFRINLLQPANGSLSNSYRLFDQGSHREAVDQPPPDARRVMKPTPQPSADDGRRLPRARGDFEERRQRLGGLGKLTLIRERLVILIKRIAGKGSAKKLGVVSR